MSGGGSSKQLDLLGSAGLLGAVAVMLKPYTVDELRDLGNQIDANGDGDFCLKAVSNLRGASVTQWGFFYGARDNDTAAS